MRIDLGRLLAAVLTVVGIAWAGYRQGYEARGAEALTDRYGLLERCIAAGEHATIEVIEVRRMLSWNLTRIGGPDASANRAEDDGG